MSALPIGGSAPLPNLTGGSAAPSQSGPIYTTIGDVYTSGSFKTLIVMSIVGIIGAFIWSKTRK